MKFGPVPLDEAEGKILGHNVAGPDGKRLLRKGKPLDAEDVDALRGLGRRVVYVAELEPDDVEENEAARRVAQAAVGASVRLRGAATGRINVLAAALGVFRIDAKRLAELNRSEGITLASMEAHSVVRPGQVVATVKVIPYAIPSKSIAEVEAIGARPTPLLWVDALEPKDGRAVEILDLGGPADEF